MAKSKIYQIKATIIESDPPIWRRILVKPNISLYEFHVTLQAVFGWQFGHLHEFIVGDKSFGVPDPVFHDPSHPGRDEKIVKLGSVVKKEKSAFLYVYDLGDCWEHEILLEKKLPEETGAHYPVCIGGERNCPPEDCGGIWGYSDFLETIKDRDHPEHESMLEWIGGRFDPEEFHLKAANESLAHFLTAPPMANDR